MPASAFYCTLCKEFSGDDMCAETHLKSKRHYERYMVSSASRRFVFNNRMVSENTKTYLLL